MVALPGTRYRDHCQNKGLVSYSRTEVFLLPSLNPDGFKRSREGCTFLSKYVLSQNFIMKQDLWRLVSRMFNAGTAARLNARGVDLNRDFPKQFDESVFGMSFEEMGRNKRMLHGRKLSHFHGNWSVHLAIDARKIYFVFTRAAQHCLIYECPGHREAV